MNEIAARLAQHENAGFGHSRIALSWSGGKDSTACLYLLKPWLDKLMVYHLDTGDLLPEVRDFVAENIAWIPHFTRIETNVSAWIDRHGMPTDLLPYSAHPIGSMTGEEGTKLVPRFDCCFLNLMSPLFARVRDDGYSMLIRGTKRCDMKRLPMDDGGIVEGVELFYPLLNWSNADVFAYLKEQGVKLPRVYDYYIQSPECARCSAWWSEGRAKYLKRFHPDLYHDYMARLRLVDEEILPSLARLKRELAVADG